MFDIDIYLHPFNFYHRLQLYVLSDFSLNEYGFPLLDSGTGTVHIFPKSAYFSSLDINKQKCRCLKEVSLLNLDWYNSKCQYHPLKIDHSKRYRCCGRYQAASGCTFSKYHVSSYLHLHGDWYSTTQSRGRQPLYTRFQSSNVFALDCEFVYTPLGMEVARVSVVSAVEGVVYDEYVKPNNQVLDYNTTFSGIRQEHLAGENVKTLSDVQLELLHILNKDSILIGHGLHSDLAALHITHTRVVDTSIAFKHHRGFPYRYSLQYLAKHYLKLDIHNDKAGHDSVQDAQICLDLMFYKVTKSL